MPHIIAFYSPRPGMGKSTAAEAAQRCFDMLKPRQAAIISSFAKPIKRALYAVFDDHRFMQEDLLRDDLKLNKDASYIAECEYPSPRAMTIAIGQALKELDPDIWVKLMADSIAGHDRLDQHSVIDDLRFPQEYDMLRERGAKIIRIWKPGQSIEPTETEGLLEGYSFDAEITNDGTLADFQQRVVVTVKELIK